MSKWATYDDSQFPVVRVKMKGVIRNDKDFTDFINEWLKLYERNEEFVFYFDTRDVGWVNAKYAYRMSKFISNLKRRNSKEYLQRSYIVYNSWYIKSLLNFIFFLQSPVAPVEMITEKEFERLRSLENQALLSKNL